MQQINPTRMNLLLRKAQITLAQQGVDLLKKKRDALSKEFMAGVQSFVDVKTRTLEKLDKAVASLIMSLAVDGPEHVGSAGLAWGGGGAGGHHGTRSGNRGRAGA